MMKGFNACEAGFVWQGEALGVIVKHPESTAAQSGAGNTVASKIFVGSAGSDKHGTMVPEDWVANPLTTLCCADLGSKVGNGLVVAVGEGPAKIELSVNKGTESCASERRPSKEMKRNVLSFLIGKPTLPPNCWRFKGFLIGSPTASSENESPGCNAGLKAKGSQASIASFRKKPKRLPCRSFLPDLDTMLMDAPLAPPRSAA